VACDLACRTVGLSSDMPACPIFAKPSPAPGSHAWCAGRLATGGKQICTPDHNSRDLVNLPDLMHPEIETASLNLHILLRPSTGQPGYRGPLAIPAAVCEWPPRHLEALMRRFLRLALTAGSTSERDMPLKLSSHQPRSLSFFPRTRDAIHPKVFAGI
jgi:hypothetical protein